MDLSSTNFNHEGSDLKILTRNIPITNLPTDGIVLDIVGDLNLYSTPALKTILNNLVDAGKIKIYINSEELSYIDSSGLGAILSIQSRLMKMNGFVKICSPSKQVLAVLELTKLKTMLKVSLTLEDALRF
jgi:anti-sigma B factor antagonist